MDSIAFSFNWNNKLAGKAFTTIRLYQPEKYRVGSSYVILLRNKHLMTGGIVAIKNFMLSDLTEFMAYIDTGYSKAICEGIIRKMYPKIDFSKRMLSDILIVREGQSTGKI